MQKKSEKALSQADFSKNPVISFSVLRAIYELSFMTVLFLSGYEHYKRCSLGRSGAPLPVAD